MSRAKPQPPQCPSRSRTTSDPPADPAQAELPRAHRGSLLYYVGDPSVDARAIRWVEDGLLVVAGGRVVAAGTYDELATTIPPTAITHHSGCWLIPGFIDGHLHYPQIGMIGSYGAELLEWLERYTFPHERRLSDPAYAERLARVFMAELLRHGTTTAAVMCSVHPTSVDALASVALALDVRIILGKVLMDRNAPLDLCDTAQQSHDDCQALIARYHGRQRLTFAVTPRFAPTSSQAQLEIAGSLHRSHPTTYVHTHLAESKAELAWVARLFPERKHYTDVYAHYDLVGPRSIFAHGIHLSESELKLLAGAGSTLAFCPTSNLFLGSGLFPLRRAQHAGAAVVLATDVGAGTTLNLLQTSRAAYDVLRLQGHSIAPHESLHRLTLGAASALSLDQHIGSFQAGREADFLVIDPTATPLLQLRFETAESLDEQLFALLTLGDDRVVSQVYVAGQCRHSRADEP